MMILLDALWARLRHTSLLQTLAYTRWSGIGTGALRRVVLGVLLATLALSPAPQAVERELIVMLDADPASLNPFKATDANGMRISVQLIHQTLVVLDDALEFAPGLAERWDRPAPDRLRFTLRSGVKFHGGQILEAADVVATLERFMAPETGAAIGGVLREKIKSLAAPDARTVEVGLTGAYADILGDLMLPIVSRAGMAGANPGEPLNGTGPFKFQSQSPGEIVLERFEGFHGAKAGVPRVVFKVVKDENTRLLKLRKGDIDLALNVIPQDKLDLVKEPPLGEKYRILEAPGLSFQYLGFNAEHPVLKHPKVRQAIAHAVDVDSLITHRQEGHSTRAAGLFPQGSPYSDPGVKPYAYDPARAAALLDEAGYPLKAGQRFALEYKTSTDRSGVVQARIIADQLAKVGIAVEVRSYEWATFYADVTKGNFDLFSLRWVGVSEPGFYHNLLHSEMMPPQGRNRGRYRNARVDELVEQGRILNDPVKR
ncbi:MAG: ABC transporter substrate-binding protein, partial [Deltaproteobacteria bacterium]|nr:ABC transporter substrate-binding protein [Deltaproteobacteria bacterium]